MVKGRGHGDLVIYQTISQGLCFSVLRVDTRGYADIMDELFPYPVQVCIIIEWGAQTYTRYYAGVGVVPRGNADHMDKFILPCPVYNVNTEVL